LAIAIEEIVQRNRMTPEARLLSKNSIKSLVSFIFNGSILRPVVLLAAGEQRSVKPFCSFSARFSFPCHGIPDNTHG